MWLHSDIKQLLEMFSVVALKWHTNIKDQEKAYDKVDWQTWQMGWTGWQIFDFGCAKWKSSQLFLKFFIIPFVSIENVCIP
jgi:hypothetical protein